LGKFEKNVSEIIMGVSLIFPNVIADTISCIFLFEWIKTTENNCFYFDKQLKFSVV